MSNMTENRVRQEDLVLPTILMLASVEKVYFNYGIRFSGVTTASAKKAVIDGIKHMLSPEDLKPLKGRNDLKIDQTFRNLISHKILEDRELVTFNEDSSMMLSEVGYKNLFDYFNERFELRGEPSLTLRENNYKKSIFKAFDDSLISVNNPFVVEINEKIQKKIKEILKRKEAKQSSEIEQPTKEKRTRTLKKM